MRNICIQCEENREALTSEWDIIPKFVNVAKVDEPSAELIRQVRLRWKFLASST